MRSGYESRLQRIRARMRTVYVCRACHDFPFVFDFTDVGGDLIGKSQCRRCGKVGTRFLFGHSEEVDVDAALAAVIAERGYDDARL